MIILKDLICLRFSFHKVYSTQPSVVINKKVMTHRTPDPEGVPSLKGPKTLLWINANALQLLYGLGRYDTLVCFAN